MQDDEQNRLKAAREAANIPRYKAAFHVDVTDKTLGTWESGQRSPSLEQSTVLARLYGVDPNWLAGWEAPTPKAG